jgi:hypothetical protein
MDSAMTIDRGSFLGLSADCYDATIRAGVGAAFTLLTCRRGARWIYQ